MCFMWLLSALFLEGFDHFIHIMLIKVVLSQTNKQNHPPKQQKIGWISREELDSVVPGLLWVSYLEKKNLWLHNIFHLTVEEEIVFSLWQWGKLKGWVKQLAIRGTIVETHSYSSVIIQLLKEYILHEVAYSSSKSLTISCKQLIILCVHLQVLQL